jgi:hypothetical protein
MEEAKNCLNKTAMLSVWAVPVFYTVLCVSDGDESKKDPNEPNYTLHV